MFLLAGVGSGVYNVVLILHILSVLIAFAPAVVHPLASSRLANDEHGLRSFAAAAVINTRTIHLPALVAVGVLGFALVGVSDKAYKYTDPWVVISIVLWLAIAGLISALVLPGDRAIAAGEPGGESKVQLGGGIVALLLLVVVVLMVVKPS